ncbi:glycyl-radical enzyme activating protein [Pelovirga terrestris]|uniref:Glycyl-radical enzyme activating protein n=1 Tax=Pelovirga terrestris TaxID=2771352 RepID=A0A8J6QQC2_9BACT|nr:glycyl-radical enzyme activating protein [Pelovirga terrestris]MBD1401081.1 glycyl-radical enzyme activating protein [Pelovirga terrestris]
MPKPLIFDIKRYAINDGPGIRLAIYFKGCSLRCVWCHNPESIAPQAQKLYTPERCISCGECVKICPQQALEITAQGIRTDSKRCTLCGNCTRVCPTRAMEISGEERSVDELMRIIEREQHLFDQSGGGVTVSGGEPLLYPDYLFELFDRCGERMIHRAIDTAGHVPEKILLAAAERTDLFLFDLKLIDSQRHQRYTGVDNRLILSNLRLLAATGAPIQIRIPLIKGINASDQDLQAFAATILSLPGEKKSVALLPYHAIAVHKYRKLGSPYQEDALQPPEQKDLDRAIDCFSQHGLSASVGG